MRCWAEVLGMTSAGTSPIACLHGVTVTKFSVRKPSALVSHSASQGFGNFFAAFAANRCCSQRDCSCTLQTLAARRLSLLDTASSRSKGTSHSVWRSIFGVWPVADSGRAPWQLRLSPLRTVQQHREHAQHQAPLCDVCRSLPGRNRAVTR